MKYRLERYGVVNVLPVMAAPMEFGPHLQARIHPLITGIGPVEAAVSLTYALTCLEGADSLPDLVLSLGSCGSPTLEHAAVYQAASVSYRDMDASPLGFPKGVTPLLDLPPVLPLPCPIPDVPTATLSTGANVVSGAGYTAIEADMVDMETWALVRAAQRFDIPLVALRGVSDGKAELTGLDDWRSPLVQVDESLAAALDRLIAVLTEQGPGALEIPARPGQDPAASAASESFA